MSEPGQESVAARPPLRETVARDLRHKIVTGDLEPGHRLREEHLAAEYGMSRVPAREALHLLSQEGFVDIVPRRGAAVAFPSARRTRELVVIRESLEVLAAGLAAQRHGGDQAPELSGVLDRAARAIDEQAFDTLPALIDQFHDTIGDASGNRELAKMLRTVRAQVRWIYEMHLERRSAQSWQHHREIAEAVLAGDRERAEERMRADVTRDAELLLNLLLARTDQT